MVISNYLLRKHPLSNKPSAEKKFCKTGNWVQTVKKVINIFLKTSLFVNILHQQLLKWHSSSITQLKSEVPSWSNNYLINRKKWFNILIIDITIIICCNLSQNADVCVCVSFNLCNYLTYPLEAKVVTEFNIFFVCVHLNECNLTVSWSCPKVVIISKTIKEEWQSAQEDCQSAVSIS